MSDVHGHAWWCLPECKVTIPAFALHAEKDNAFRIWRSVWRLVHSICLPNATRQYDKAMAPEQERQILHLFRLSSLACAISPQLDTKAMDKCR